MRFPLITITLAVLLAACSSSKPSADTAAAAPKAADGPPPTVSQLDVNRYLGNWYEIAAYPMFFQNMCKANTQAKYALDGSNNIIVMNSCDDEKGEKRKAVGKAWTVDAKQPGKLQVTFLPDWISWAPIGRGDYWVVALPTLGRTLAKDAPYPLSIVSSPGRSVLWILSRTPTLSDADKKATLAEIEKLGFDTTKLVFKPHTAAK